MANKWLNLFPGAKRTKADFCLDGDAYYESVIRAIESTAGPNHFIYILGWMLDIDFQLAADDRDKTLYQLLKAASERGVEIRILVWNNFLPDYTILQDAAIPRLNKLANTRAFVDSNTFFPSSSKAIIQKLRPYLVDLVKRYGPLPGFNPNQTVSAFYILRQLGFILSSQSIGAHHEKVVIVNGKSGNADSLVAFCGGIDFNRNRVYSTITSKSGEAELSRNLAEAADKPDRPVKAGKHQSEYRFPYYHDTACRLEGPAAHQILQRFKRRWRNHPDANKETIRGENLAEPKERPVPYPYTQVVGTYNSVDGREKDRSLRDAYLKIIENAKRYIYIEDQYLVNLDVARALNKKIKESGFSKLTFAIQDSIETSDILIPNRKRGEFLSAVLDGATDGQKEKVLLAVIDRTNWERARYHPGMHAKTLIVDDEIAIIGSANVNQRSFTIDSETSVVVFDEVPESDPKSEHNFARNFRVKTWGEFAKKTVPKGMIQSWWNYPTSISNEEPGFSILIKYQKDLQDDLDLRINTFIRGNSVVVAAVVSNLLDQDLTRTSVVMSPYTITYLFDTLWEHFVDPSAP
ncbi:MAG TPA: phospholipase D-like domain-containing protein [Blastocatellia bacterium]|nr:phospholipase D-like domain-containing protein [Blastocatellia bacterium]